ncbi:type II and III secretion system protein family protein [Spongiibacter sp. KMU-158]|uniref:Type II and III secretion system protein family protein n=1 Tax=Spongiibacter pelagi TaxID=2760804 RepID=A0A927C251_9GAMM|nr:type II and III secretion system protein family protein [Spongiibacter pelagi]MBD2858477.1 type II and III secretion system protein family protein [Spongiibacter pelagi]
MSKLRGLNLFVFAALLLNMVSISLAQAEAPFKVMRMLPGEQRPLVTQYSVKRSAIGKPDIATLKVLNSKEFLITAKQVGSTQLLLWQSGSTPTVIRIDVAPAINSAANPGVKLDVRGDQVFMEGQVNSLQQHQQLLNSSGEKSIDNTFQPGAIQVQTDVKIVEYSRSKLKQIGTALSFVGGDTSAATGSTALLPLLESNPVGALLGGLTTGKSASSILIGHATDNFSAAVNALRQNGYAYTLAEPSLVSLSGQTASFLAGGEFPYPVSSREGQVQIEFKEFGVRLKLTPTVLSENSIMLKVAPEVSDLDFSSGVQASGVSVPALRVRRTDTSIQLAPGESFIISGLISRTTFNNADRVPGLGDLPIIGALFRSSYFEQDDKELVMIVTPHLVKPLAKGTDIGELPGDIYKDYTPSFSSMLFGDPMKGNKPKRSDSAKSAPASVGFSN